VSRPEAPSAAASVRVGGYTLDVGKGSGSFARFEPTEEREKARDLKAALAQDDATPAPVVAIEEFQETADAVTSRIEQADQLLTAAADGRLLEPGNLNSEINALLDLFGRLDRAGRFEEELKLMRSLNGLLALTLRWLELIRSLRSLLRSATAAGHQAGQAFAHHELGSLYLCAGRAKDASKHLSEALRIEKQLGDFASQCPTRHNLDSARRDTLARRAWRRSRRQLLYSALIAAAFVLLGGGGGTGLAFAIRGGGGGAGGDSSSHGSNHSPATLTVHQDFEPNAVAVPVTFSVTCTNGGRPDKSSKIATETVPASFSISGLGEGATCTATESAVPTGYRAIERGCRNISIARGSSASCVIINVRKTGTPHRGGGTVTLTVFDSSPAQVGIAVTCDSGTVAAVQPVASRGSPARFSISGFRSGATCAAAEKTTPSGYSADESKCRRVTITSGGSPACTIVETLNSARLTVRIDYTDGSTSRVYVTLACPSGGTVTSASPSGGNSQLASPDSPASFTISGFPTGATCSASEDKVPGGYTPDESDCQDVPLASKSECTIVNSATG